MKFDGSETSQKPGTTEGPQPGGKRSKQPLSFLVEVCTSLFFIFFEHGAHEGFSYQSLGILRCWVGLPTVPPCCADILLSCAHRKANCII